MSRRLVLISEHFEPSQGATAQLMADLAGGLQSSGWDITVLTATPGTSWNVPVVRICDKRKRSTGKRDIRTKVVRGLKFLAGALLWIVGRTGENEVILIASNPPFIGLLGVILHAIRGQPYVFIFQDLFPRSAILSGVLPPAGPVAMMCTRMMKEVCKRSKATIVLSVAMESRLKREFKDDLPLHVIPNWAVEKGLAISRTETTFAKEHGFADRFTLQYSGNFGRMHDLLTILGAARLLQKFPIQFVFIGGGAKLKEIVNYRDEFKLSNVLRLPYQPRKRLPETLAACDMSAIGLIPGAEDTVAPCKFYGILASGRGVVLVIRRNCDLARLVLREQCGIVVEPGETEELAENLCQLATQPDTVRELGERAKSLYERQFGLKPSLEAYSSLLEKITNDDQ
jgi:glycosyltransferase involved in cell wall biosynthesis